MSENDTTSEDTRAALDLLASALATTLPAFVVNGVANALEAIMKSTRDPANIRAGIIAKGALQAAIIRAVKREGTRDYTPPFRPGAGGPRRGNR